MVGSLVISLDIETHSPVDLTACGASVYFEHPATDVLCVAYHAVGSLAPVALWRRGEPPPTDFVDFVNKGATFSGWNVIGFDRLGYASILACRQGFPPIEDSRWVDSMHLAAAANLPRSLEGCAGAVGVVFEKNLKDQQRLRRITNALKTPVPSAEDLDWLFERCVQDVAMEEQVLMCLPAWPSMAPWLHMPAIDRRINDRGVLIDVELVQGLSRAAASETHRLNGAMAALTKDKVPATTNIESLKHWLIERGVPVPLKNAAIEDDVVDEGEESETEKKSAYRLRKNDIADLLARDDIPEECRQAMLYRTEAAKASVRKLNAMLRGANNDGRLRGALILMGAQQSARFSSTRMQCHNLPRDSFANADEVADETGLNVKKDAAEIERRSNAMLYTAIETGRIGDADMLRMLYESKKKDAQGRPYTAGVLAWTSRMLRRVIAAPAGSVLLDGDFSSIEARITAWLAQQTDVLQAYFNNDDVYRVTAGAMFGVPPGDITKLQRQSGKVSILANSFGGGYNALIAMAYNYGMLLTIDQAKDYTNRFRQANDKIKQYWYATDDAAANAVLNPGREYPVPPCGLVTYFMQDDCLCARLPSGRLLRYWQPRLSQEYWSDGQPKDRLSLTALAIKGRAVFRRSTYHTILVENVAQAIAVDLLCTALSNLDAAGLPVSLHVHDSAAAEVQEDRAEALLPVFNQCMLDQPSWCYGLPVGAETKISARFG